MPNSRRSLALALLTLLLTLMAVPAQAQQGIGEQEVTVAVLPFEVNAGDDLAYLKDSLPQLLVDRLRQADLAVVDPAEVLRVIENQGITTLDADSAREVALLVGAGYALYGSFNQLGETLTLDARLVEAFGLAPSVPLSVSKQGLINLLPAADDLVSQVRKNVLGEKVVAEIDVSGNNILDKEVVLMRLSIRKGDDYSPKRINDDLKTIFDLGYFENVEVRVTDVPGGKKVVFVVEEKPRIQAISVEGADDIDPDDILGVITTSEGSILNLKVLQDDLNIIRVLYRKEGHYKSQVNYRIEGGETGQARLIFVVDEGPILYVEDIIFDGVEQVDEDDLEDLLSLSETGFFSWFTDAGVLNEESLDRDASAIQAYYQNNGFLQVRVGRPEVDIRDDGIFVTFRVEEGPRYKINDIGFKGDVIAPPEELMDVIKLDEHKEDEEYYSTEVMREDIDKLTRYYNDKGFAYAEVTPNLDATDEGQMVNVDYEISKHQRVHIRRVLVVGNDKTRDNIILREMLLLDGDQFSGTKLEVSKERLEQLSYFEVVNIETVPTGDPDEMDLKVSVKEQATGKLTGGVGYSSYGGAYFGGSASEANLFGKGYTLTFTGTFGGTTNEFELEFINPRVNDSKWAMGISAYNRDSTGEYYDLSRYGTEMRVAHPLGHHSYYRFIYELSQYRIFDVDSDAAQDIKDDAGDHLLSSLAYQMNRSTVKHRGIIPVAGTEQEFMITYAGSVLGGDDAFVKYTGSADWYANLFADVVFHARGGAGYIHENFGAEEIPTNQRFYLGGLNTVRGYSSSMISPRDEATDDAIGGNKILYANLEFFAPISTNLGLIGVVFFDAGGNWEEGELFFDESEAGDGYEAPIFGLYKSIGAGVRWMSPMGPVRFEYGFGLDELEGSQNHKVEFSMGQLF